ncbi:MAG: globin [Sulfurimonas sp.]|nr:globin [Sulfurimonas sp.]
MLNYKITKTIFGERPKFPKPNPKFMEVIDGEKGMEALFDKFYDMISESEIAHFFPQEEEEMNLVKQRNTKYFIEFYGGTKGYSRIPDKSMDVIKMHVDFSITEKARYGWLSVVQDLLEELDIEDELKQGFWDTFESFSKWTVNRNTKTNTYEEMVKV